MNEKLNEFPRIKAMIEEAEREQDLLAALKEKAREAKNLRPPSFSDQPLDRGRGL